MIKFVRDSYPKARKRHLCLACFELSEADLFDNPAELRDWLPKDIEILKSLTNNKFIEKGEKYYHQVYTYDGEISDFRAKITAHKLCLKYGIYGDE